MCTVSFYKSTDHVIITSNRDESINRPLALTPRKITSNNSIIYCPIDPQHNGTWFAVNQNKSVFVILNGADKKHFHNPPYKKSRGLILLEIAESHNYLDKWLSIDLVQIENFTMVAYFKGKLAQLRWDGSTKSHLFLDENKAHIWSSSTLYDEQTIKKREEWFYDFLANKNNEVTSNDIIDFHINTKNEDTDNGLIINRTNNMLTKNVTQTILYASHFQMQHWDLIKNKKHIIEKSFQ
jgi:uncharacterized protein with NRDE domain